MGAAVTPVSGEPATSHAAIVLAGGRATRLGGADKAAVTLNGETLLSRSCRALMPLEPQQIVVVGPAQLLPAAWPVRFVVEEPRFSGPAQAIATAVAALNGLDDSTRVTLLPCDLIEPAAAVTALARWEGDADGAVLSADSRRQWTTLRAPLGALRRAAKSIAPDDSIRYALRALQLQDLEISADSVRDLDSLSELRGAGARLPEGATVTQQLHPDLLPWVEVAATELGLTADEVPVEVILDLARDVAHGAVRPGAPVTAFMLGYALAAGRIDSATDAANRLSERAAGWADSRRAPTPEEQ